MSGHLSGRWLKNDLIQHLRESHPEVRSASTGSAARVARLFPLGLLEEWHAQQHAHTGEHPVHARPGSA